MVKVTWYEERERALQELKIQVMLKLYLFRFQADRSLSFELYTEASDFAMGAVLRQTQGGREVPVGCFSSKLTGSQLI